MHRRNRYGRLLRNHLCALPKSSEPIATLWDALQGAYDADLGGGVFKYRLARDGEGTSGGSRAIVAMRSGERAVMMYGFEKKDLANITTRELAAFKKAARIDMSLSEQEITIALKEKALIEITKPAASAGTVDSKAKGKDKPGARSKMSVRHESKECCMAIQKKPLVAGIRSLKSRSDRPKKVEGCGRRSAGSTMAYRSPAFAAVHEGISDLRQAGLVDAQTMREFDVACLTPVMTLSPAAIRNIRKKAAISQSVFALHLNVTTGVISKWERGEKQPSGPAAKLLTLAAKNGIAAIA